ncbi:DUF3106 domain-containing protein [Paucibacter sp. AS339]|uniref:DUF3106 domain-containing protein n=1 Tax=Paucibacter hankyongi TaxID=3133434 RepID=UPI0030A936E4
MSKSDRVSMPPKNTSLNLKGADIRRSPRLAYGLIAALGLGFATIALSQQDPPQAADASASSAVGSAPVAAPLAEQARAKVPAPAPAPNAAARLLPAPNWPALSPGQRQALAPLEHDWNELDAARKSQWLEVAARFGSLDPQDQARMQERMRDWARLSPVQRQEARIGFQVAKKIDADARQAKWEAYQALPPEQRQQLADKAALKQEKQAGKLNSASSISPASVARTKSNLVPEVNNALPPKPVAASLLQAKPGATTVLMTTDRAVPGHLQAGDTKIMAHPELVDGKTLLPKKRSADTKTAS